MLRMVGVTEERIRVRYGDTDQMGHAYYANYLYWFEQARGAWCRERGFTYKQLEEQELFLPVVEVYARYKGEVHYDDWVVVRVRVSELKRAAIKFEYEVFNETTGKLATEGHTWHVVMSPTARKAISIPPHMRELLERDPDDFETLP
jgi:acyl-CoA thioester hydrolase